MVWGAPIRAKMNNKYKDVQITPNKPLTVKELCYILSNLPEERQNQYIVLNGEHIKGVYKDKLIYGVGLYVAPKSKKIGRY